MKKLKHLSFSSRILVLLIALIAIQYYFNQ